MSFAVSQAQDTTPPQQIVVAVGSKSGTYGRFMTEIKAVMPEFQFKEVESSGSLASLDALFGNQVSMAFIQSDVLRWRSQTANMDALKTLVTLYQEEIHFVAGSSGKRSVTSGGSRWWSKNEVQQVPLNSIDDLRDCKVGAAGGSWVSAQVVKQQGTIGYEVVEYKNSDEVLAALSRHEIDAGCFVGGAPLGILASLDATYKLLSASDRLIKSLNGIYKPASVTYLKMAPDSTTVLAAEALIVARDYKTPKMRNSLLEFRRSLYNHLDELKETPGYHPKWSEVDQNNKGLWKWLE